jgi:hypothetical protein
METQELYKAASWFNPFFVNVGFKHYEIKEIYLYRPDGTFIRNCTGWFGDNNQLDSLKIPAVILRRTPKFDGKTFVISKGREEFGTNKQLLCHLYIPIEWFDLIKTERTRKEGFITIHTPVYTSSWEPKVWIEDYKRQYTTEDASTKARVMILVAEKMQILGRLEEIDGELGKLDPRSRIEETARKVSEKIKGAKP